MPDYRIRTRTLKRRPTATIHVACRPSRIAAEMGELLPVVGGYLEGLGVAPLGGPFARYFDETEDEVEFEGGFMLGEAVPGDDQIAAGELPGGLAATATHVGPLGPAMERDPSKLHTDIVRPLRR